MTDDEKAARYALPSEPKILELKSSLRPVSAAVLRAREIPARTYLPLLGQDGWFVVGHTHMLGAFVKTGKTELLAHCIHDWISRPLIPTGELELKPEYMPQPPQTAAVVDENYIPGVRASDIKPVHLSREEREEREAQRATRYQPRLVYPKILYLGEESEDMWAERLQKLPDSENWDQMDYKSALGMTDKQMMALIHSHDGDPEDWAGDYALGEVVGYDIVILDTIRGLLNIENENDNSEITAKVKPWVALAQRTGITLIMLHHTRKSGGDFGQGFAGGTGGLALVDHLITMERDSENPSGPRLIHHTGRGDKESDKAKIGWVEITTPQGIGTGQYRMEFLGTAKKVTRDSVEEQILPLLGAIPQTTGQIHDQLTAAGLKASLPTVLRALKNMAWTGRAIRHPDIRQDAEKQTVKWTAAVPDIDI